MWKWWRKYKARRDEFQQNQNEAQELLGKPDATTDQLANLTHLLTRQRPFSNYRKLVAGVCAHANTSPESLRALLVSDSEIAVAGLSTNPILPLLTLECPDLPTAVPLYVALSLVRRPGLTAAMAQFLTLHPAPLVAWEAETSVAVSGEIIAAEDWRKAIETAAQTLARHPMSYESWLDQSLWGQSEELLLNLAELGIIPPEILPVRRGRDYADQWRLEFAKESGPFYKAGAYPLRTIFPGGPATGLRAFYFKSPTEFRTKDGLVYDPATPTDTLAATLADGDSSRWHWARNHPHFTDTVAHAWRTGLITRAFQLRSGSPIAAYFTLTRHPPSLWQQARSLGMVFYEDPAILPDPWTLCGAAVIYETYHTGFGPLERCAAIPLLSAPGPLDFRRRSLIRRLLNDNNRYVRAAARERFGQLASESYSANSPRAAART